MTLVGDRDVRLPDDDGFFRFDGADFSPCESPVDVTDEDYERCADANHPGLDPWRIAARRAGYRGGFEIAPMREGRAFCAHVYIGPSPIVELQMGVWCLGSYLCTNRAALLIFLRDYVMPLLKLEGFMDRWPDIKFTREVEAE